MIKITESRYIDEPVENILKAIRQETSDRGDMFLKDIIKRGHNFVVTCPFHSDHKENKPACTVFAGEHNNFKEGDYHCFVCNAYGPMHRLVSSCFGEGDEFGKEWLIEKYGNTFVEHEFELETIDLSKPFKTIDLNEYLDESILDSFQPYHPYMETRKLSKEVCEKFKVKYDPLTKSLVFPVWDEIGRLYMLTRRSVVDKSFIIDAAKEKPIYLMNHIKNNNIPFVIVVESQINALTCYSYGLPAVATFGVGITPKQFEILNKSNIIHYILAFDGDEAGKRGAAKFIKNIRKDSFVDVITLPEGKDINDLDKQSFIELLSSQGLDYDTLKNTYDLKIKKDKF
jgi:DNA primase